MPTTPWEIEAKLTLARAQDARAIARLRALGTYRLRVLPTQRLRTTYLDTPTFSLARQGVALRVRRDGARWEATAKWGGQVTGAVHRRAELTVPLDTPVRFPFVIPPGPLADRLTALLAGSTVTPIFTTDILRQRRAVVAGGDAPVAELDIDTVTLRPARRGHEAIRFWEVEIELIDGRPRDVAGLAQVLRRTYALTPSADSKFTRGLHAFYPHITANGDPSPIIASDSVATAARKTVARHLARMQRHDPGTRAGHDPEAVHDMRVAIRRLRAALRALKPGFPKALRGTLKQELAWVGQVLGDVRDLDVQLEYLAKHGSGRGLEPLRRHLQAQRARRRKPLRSALDSPRYLALIATLDRFAPESDDGSRQPVGRRGRRVVQRAFRRLMKEGQRAMANPTPERLHALRISAKRTRYVLEFLKEIAGRPGVRLTKALVALQDTLGMQHDAVVAVNTTGALIRTLNTSSTRAGLAQLRAFAAAQERDADRYRRRAQVLWRDFSRPRVKREIATVLTHLQQATRDQR